MIPWTPWPVYQDVIAKDPKTHSSMLIPIILGSDRTTVSVTTGQNEYWPIYLSIGNIYNNVHQAHHNSIVLLGFLHIPKGKHCMLTSIVIITQPFP